MQQLQQLSNEHSILVLTLLILEGEQDLDILRMFPDETAEPLLQAGQALSEIGPRKQVLPQLITELKKRLKLANKSTTEHFSADWLAEFLQHESPIAISCVLRNFPRPIANQIAKNFPPTVTQSLPTQPGTVEPEILRVVQEAFEGKVPELPEYEPEELNLSALKAAKAEEIYMLIREIGFVELAVAFRGAGKGPLTELCRRLGAEEAENLLSTIKRLPPSPSDEVKAAQRSIRAISFTHSSRSEIVEEAGLNLLHAALLSLPERERQLIAYRLPKRIGQRLLLPESTPIDDLQRLKLQHRIANTLQYLSEKERIAPFWKHIEITLPPLPEPEPEEEEFGELTPDDEETGDALD
ncbi:MAG: hypothetical protein CL920_15700 [Deltaproteobacteria bacterium]|nr:hypothetical protein [Deltaproteobacteria bacterium]|tara:strand:+ start:12117 stop:13178 length:1062 start_codon:yes stop_codon:yes gene_type:complete